MFSVNASVRRRFNNFSSAITNRLWLNAHTNYECDVLLTFPTHSEDFTLIWFLEQLHHLAPDIRVSIKYHFTTGEKYFFAIMNKINLYVYIFICCYLNRCIWILCNVFV